MILFLYLFLLLLGLIVGATVQKGMGSGFGSSLEINQLLNGFNRTAFFDFINANPDFLPSILKWVKINVVLYLIVGSVLNGGLLANILSQKESLSAFFSNSLKYALPFILISVFTLLVILLWTSIIFIPYAMILGNPLADYTNELPFLYSFLLVFIVYVIGMIFIVTHSIISRIFFIESNRFFSSLKKSANILFANKITYLGWGTLILAFHMLVLYCYYLVYMLTDASSWVMIFCSFFAIQFTVFLRLLIKAANFSGINHLVSQRPKK